MLNADSDRRRTILDSCNLQLAAFVLSGGWGNYRMEWYGMAIRWNGLLLRHNWQLGNGNGSGNGNGCGLEIGLGLGNGHENGTGLARLYDFFFTNRQIHSKDFV